MSIDDLFYLLAGGGFVAVQVAIFYIFIRLISHEN